MVVTVTCSTIGDSIEMSKSGRTGCILVELELLMMEEGGGEVQKQQINKERLQKED